MKILGILAAALSAAAATAPALAAQAGSKTAHPPGHEMSDPASGGAGAGAMDHDAHCGMPMGEGVISALDVKASKATIAHAPIPAIGWGKMTMSFGVDKPVDLAAFAAGEKVHFLLKESASKKGKTYSIAAMCATEAPKATHEACMGHMHKIAMELADKAGTPCSMDKMSMDGMDHGAMKGMDHGDHH